MKRLDNLLIVDALRRLVQQPPQKRTWQGWQHEAQRLLYVLDRQLRAADDDKVQKAADQVILSDDEPLTIKDLEAIGETKVELIAGDLYIGGRYVGHGPLAHGLLRWLAATAGHGDKVRDLERILCRAAARPIVDARSADEILGYDDDGLPR
jgi:hypothetical protein